MSDNDYKPLHLGFEAIRHQLTALFNEVGGSDAIELLDKISKFDEPSRAKILNILKQLIEKIEFDNLLEDESVEQLAKDISKSLVKKRDFKVISRSKNVSLPDSVVKIEDFRREKT